MCTADLMWTVNSSNTATACTNHRPTMQYAGTHMQPFEDWYRVIIMSTFSANNHNNTIQMHDWLSNNKILTNIVNNLYNSPAASLCSKQAKLNITTSAPGMRRSRCYRWFESRAAVYGPTRDSRTCHAHNRSTDGHGSYLCCAVSWRKSPA